MAQSPSTGSGRTEFKRYQAASIGRALINVFLAACASSTLAAQSSPTTQVVAALPQPNLFPRQSWQPPPPPPPPPAPPPVPVAPPLPFKFLGQVVEQGETPTVFLEYSGRQLHPRLGMTIDGTYRVEQITDSAIQFVYLPLNETQTLTTGRTR